MIASKTSLKLGYGEAIREAFVYLLEKYPNVSVIGQGLWSPWYVGNSMTDLDKMFGKERVIDTPVSESATTGVGIGASLCGMRPIIIHPRVDFMILASDPIVNQASKWSSMLGGQAHPGVTIRGIVNRGGEQGAQHSQSLHSWFAHIPGLRVVMPATVADARDLMVSSVLSDDPVLYIDDRWLYDLPTEALPPVEERPLHLEGPRVTRSGSDVTLVGSGYSSYLASSAAAELASQGVSAEVIDLRVLNPFQPELIIESVQKTGRLVCVDGGWATCGMAGEVIASVTEAMDPRRWKARPVRITLPDAPAPTSKPLEAIYYPKANHVVSAVNKLMG